jgi:hypothetical protein
MTTIQVHYDGKAFVPDHPVDMPKDHPGVVAVESPKAPKVVRTEAELLALFAEMDEDSVNTGHFVDFSRDSIYSGTIDDPR